MWAIYVILIYFFSGTWTYTSYYDSTIKRTMKAFNSNIQNSKYINILLSSFASFRRTPWWKFKRKFVAHALTRKISVYRYLYWWWDGVVVMLNATTISEQTIYRYRCTIGHWVLVKINFKAHTYNNKLIWVCILYKL